MNLLKVLSGRLEVIDDSTSSSDLVNRLVAVGPTEESLHLVELDNLVKRHYQWLTCLPRVRPFYAIKSNNDPAVVETLALLGCGFDCASKGEVQRVLDLGVPREAIIYAQPAKTIEGLLFARERNVRTVFDCELELRKIQQYYPEAEVLIRFRFDAKDAQAQLGTKFGCDPDEEARWLLDLAKQLNIKVVGWCFNAGSGCTDGKIYYEAIKKGRQITDYAESIGFNFWYLDLGGGYLGDKGESLAEHAVHINKALDEFFPEKPGLQVIAEPGRYYCASVVTSVVPIHGKRVFHNSKNRDQVDHIFYYLNDGIYGSFYSAKYEGQKVLPIVWKSTDECGPIRRTTLFGPTCDGNDFFAQGIELPELQVSDFLVFENQGAYSHVTACRFNGFNLPKSVVFIRRSVWHLLEEVAMEQSSPKKLVLNSSYLQNNSDMQNIKFR
ncbi:ornithine decarboxylase 1-like [Uranotaenia lowii]|uniref:ornithine decarboxylase 1-like n=1 Tax=Uranotaenia lowii TaxID=190385 RepID=UPI0024798DA0|nr:ornithine decarboxylase 1-like [Uranotaenia lowii]